MSEVQVSDGTTTWWPTEELEPVPKPKESCYDQLVNGNFTDPDWLRRTITRLRVSGRLSDVVYSMAATNTDFYPHQFKPVLKLMDSPTDSLLIADEVGLGKTIEAGLIWTELRARHDYNRLLIICPKTLCEKWRDEFSSKFGVDVQITDARELLIRLRRTRSTGIGFATVCSLQGLRPPKRWNQFDDNESPDVNVRTELAKYLFDERDSEPLIDLLVVDEAHHMRNPKTMQNSIGTLTSDVASHRVYLSATPIHLQNRDLHSVLKMVDPNTFEYANTLNELIDANAPLVAARDLLLKNGTPAQIRECIVQARNLDLLGDSEVLNQILDSLSNESLDRNLRSDLAIRLERVNQLANFVNRTRRRDIKGKRPNRDAKTPEFTMNQHELQYYEEISLVVNEYAKQKNTNELFLLSTPQRLLTSSLAAAATYWESAESVEPLDQIEETDLDLELDFFDTRPLVSKIARRTKELGKTFLLKEHDTKFNKLFHELKKFWSDEPHEKVIIFSSFKPTLHYLRSRLAQEKIQSELLHGSIRESRSRVLSRFENNRDARVLLSSEVGSEGVDLQFCSVVVNYDIPWNPMRLEQRIGRIDRLGQKSEKIMILNLVFENTIDSRIFRRLYERLTSSERALGEMEAILGKRYRELTTKMLDPRLSTKAKEEEIDRMAQALEQERQETDRLESEAGSLVHHGDYILKQIYESRGNRRWLSQKDVLIYVRDRLESSFPGTSIESSPPGSNQYRISWSNDAFSQFSFYLKSKKLDGSTRILAADTRQRIEFTQSVLQKTGRVEYVSQLHPLVRFCVDLDRQDPSTREPRVIAAVIQDRTLSRQIEPGVYVLAIDVWISNSDPTGTHNSTKIGYVGANLETRQFISNNVAEQIATEVAENSLPMVNPTNHELFSTATSVFCELVRPRANKEFQAFRSQTKAELSDRLKIQLRSLDKNLSRRRESLLQTKLSIQQQVFLAESLGDYKRIQNLRNLELAQDARIKLLERKLQARKNELEQQQSPQLEAKDISILFVEIKQ